jgi:hypothetical protein
MAKKSNNGGDELVLIAKAIRRGEKLERTLTKLVAMREPQSDAEAFLKTVQKGLEKLRKEPTASDSEKKPAKKKAKAVEPPKSNGADAVPVIVKRARKSKKPDAPAATQAETA